MASKQCFEQGCNLEVQYVCKCSASDTYTCQVHLGKHFGLSNRNHSIDSIFLEPCEETKDAVLGFLIKEKSKKEKLKKKILDTCSQNLKGSQNSLEKSLIRLDSDSVEISNWIEKISQAQKISKLEQDPILKLLALQPEDAVKNAKEMIPENSYGNEKLFCMLSEEIERMVECFIKNSFETALNKRLSSIESRFEDNEKTFDFKLVEVNRSIYQKIDENNRNFEDWKQEINIEKRLEEYEKSINDKIAETNNSISNIINERDKNTRQKIEDLKQEINIERRFEEYDKIINGKIAEANNSISNIISEKDKNIRQKIEDLKQEINIERRFEEYDSTIKDRLAKVISENEKNQKKIEEWKLEINIEKRLQDQAKLIDSKLEEIGEKNIMKFKDLNQEIQLETQNQGNLLNSQFTSTFNDLNKKINENLLLTHQALAKKRSILSKGNSKIAEQSFREFCLLYERECPDFNLPLSQDFQEYINFYHQIASLYFTKQDCNGTKLIIYDTESERKEERILDVPEPLNLCTCITQLPNGELFCYGNYSDSGITLIIDRSYGVRILPSGIPCSYSSGIYLNDNVYCFGGQDKNRTDLTLSSKFDLNGNRWINNLNQMPQPDLLCCCVIFNGNILIFGVRNRNIWRYSVDSDAFSTIPYQFAAGKKKILINVERLYLIECGGFVYESEAGDDCAWKQISKSVIGDNCPYQVYCSYNKGGIYIATQTDIDKYYKFDLSQKIMTKLQ